MENIRDQRSRKRGHVHRFKSCHHAYILLLVAVLLLLTWVLYERWSVIRLLFTWLAEWLGGVPETVRQLDEGLH
jgi:hypothetical protein